MTISVNGAALLARGLHGQQVDKAGLPYLGHLRRVAGRCTTVDGQIVAWLHDALEDTDVTVEALRSYGVTERQLTALQLLCHAPGEPYADYIARVATDPLAVEVKRADLADNFNPVRLAMLPEATRTRLETKYQNALALLDATGETS